MRSTNWFGSVRRQLGRIYRIRLHVPARRAAVRRSLFEPLETRMLLAADFGDAPDAAAGTGSGNYNTLASDNGPSHTVVAGLRMGAAADMEDGTLQNAAASADDVHQALPDDEDGLSYPAADLTLTHGTQPGVNVIVTNTTGSAATLSGWLDYDNNGVFDNATERAQVAVATGTTDGIVTLTFPSVPGAFTGQTYARFRLSTDAAAADPTGVAADGEVEDYVTQINARALSVARSTAKVAHNVAGGPSLGNFENFGSGMAALGDLDGDGVIDLAVGASGSRTAGLIRGAIYVLFMNADATVKSSQKISHQLGGGPSLNAADAFGNRIAPLHDLDGDGVPDLAVGASGSENYRGVVHVLFMNTNGTVKNTQRIGHQVNGGPTLSGGDRFGSGVSSVGDLDGDGVGDMAVGAPLDPGGGYNRGAVHILLMNTDGTVKSTQKIADQIGGGPSLSDRLVFGGAVTALGDLDGDGVTELAVGSEGDRTGGDYRGAVHVLFLNSDGTVKGAQRIAHQTSGGPTLGNYGRFGKAVSSLSDLDGDGVRDLAVGGAGGFYSGCSYCGALHVLLMNSDGTAKSTQKITHQMGGGPTLSTDDRFAVSLAAAGDLDGDGVTDLAVGAYGDSTGGALRGALHVLFMDAANRTPTLDALADLTINQDATQQTVSLQGISAGSGENQALQVTAVSSNTGLIPHPVITYASPQATGTLTFTPLAGASGSATIAVTVEDGGTDNNLSTTNDNAKFTRSFDVAVTPVTRTVTGLVINGGSVNRSGIATVTFQFSEAATVDAAGSLILWNHTTGAAVDVSGATLANNGTIAVSWNLSGITLPDGNYTATLPKAAAGLAATHTASFHHWPGDSDGDGAVGFSDFGELAANFNVVGGPLYGPGDMDGDGNVGFSDFGVLAANFNRVLDALTLDFGDAPESGTDFPTALANDGARHVLGSGLFLGATVDAEADGQPDANAAGDGSDEDGVTFATLTAGTNAAITVAATVPGTAVLNAWVDFNLDGDWDDAGEQVFVDRALNNGANNLTVAVPAGAQAGQAMARFRVASIAGYSYSGLAKDGEVEDYRVTVGSSKSSSSRDARSVSLNVSAGLSVALLAGLQATTVDSHLDLAESSARRVELDPRFVDLALEKVTFAEPGPARLPADRCSPDEQLVDRVFEEEVVDLLLLDNELSGAL